MGLSGLEYRMLVEQAPILVWRANPSTKCDYFNERWLQFRGRTLAEETGDGWAEGVHPDDMAGCVKTYLDAFSARQQFEMEYRLMRHDGVYRWILDRGVPFYQEDGGFAGYIGSCIDVTDRVEAQREIQAIKDRELDKLRGLLEICAECKKIRNDKGEWEPLATYLDRSNNVNLSHGLCGECYKNYCTRYGLVIPSGD